MESLKTLISWAELQEHYIAQHLPIEFPVVESPRLSLVFATSPPCLGIRLSISKDRTIRPPGDLQNIIFRKVSLGSQVYLEVLTGSPALFRAIYALAGDVLLRMGDGETDAVRAVEASLADFELLLARARGLTLSEAIGLYGELVILESLLSAGYGLDCWVGAGREVHDFRLADSDLEVKTTTANSREHVIHGLNQLSPAPGRPLHLVSIRIGSGSAGGTRSIDDLVASVRHLLGNDQALQRSFDAKLAAEGYAASMEAGRVGYHVVGAPMAVEIGMELPAISYDWISSSLGTEAAARVRGVQLTLNLEGLGRPFEADQWK